MIIRAEQFEAFKPIAEAAFVRRVAALMRDRHGDVLVRLPDAAATVRRLPDGVLIELAGIGIARGRTYGVRWESTLTAFVAIMFVAAPNFDEHPLIQRVLNEEATTPDSRIDQLWERTTEQNWEAIAQNYDVNAWKPRPQEKSE